MISKKQHEIAMLCIPCADIPHFDGFVSGRGNKMISTWHKRNTGHIVIMTCSVHVHAWM